MSSNTNYGPVVPEGYSPPLSIVTPDDHEAWVLIATAIGLTCGLFFTAIRILVRLTLSRGFMGDDYSLFGATIITMIQSGLLFAACSKGLGKSLTLVNPQTQDDVQTLTYTCNLLFILALGLAKVSVVQFLLRISRVKEHRVVFKGAIAMVSAWTIASFLAIAFQCEVSAPWKTIGRNCSNLHARWIGICVADIVTEVAIIGIVIYLVWSLRTTMSSKIMVVSIFSARLLLVVAIAFRIVTFNQIGITTNPFLTQAPFIAWTQAQLSYSLVSATVPTFQNFLKTLHTGFGGIGAGGHYGYGYGYPSRGPTGQNVSEAYQLSKVDPSTNPSTIHEEEHDDEFSPQSQPVANHHRSELSEEISVNPRPSDAAADATSIGSDRSERLMIRKNVQWTVRTETRA